MLRLFSEEVLVHRVEGLASKFEATRMPLLSLRFRYGAHVLPNQSPRARARSAGDVADDTDDSACDDATSIWQSALQGLRDETPRDYAAEDQARRILEGFGAADLTCLEDLAVDPALEADYVIGHEGSLHDYCAFSAHIVPQLRRLGFLVDIDRDYEFKTLASDSDSVRWYADVEEDDKPDWFNVELGIDVDGQRLSLLPALLELLERSGTGEGFRDLVRRGARSVALPAGEKLFISVPAERIRAILRVIAELHEGNAGRPDALKFPKTRAGALDRLELAFGDDQEKLTWSGEASERARKRAMSQAPTRAPKDIAPPSGLMAQLRPYQVEGLAWLQHLRKSEVGGILADDMGLGKTLQTISHLAKEKEEGRLAKPALIVAPTSLLANWQREIGKFAPHLRVVRISGKDRALQYADIVDADVVVTSYPVICRDEAQFLQYEFSSLILDEAQTVKNDKSQAHRVVSQQRSEHRICLTGTPVENHLGELWSIVEFLNPGLLGDEVYFTRFFRRPIEKEHNTERLIALRELLSPYILRRTKADVAKELPPKTELFRPVEVRGKQRELYETIRVAAHAEVRKLIKKKGIAASTVPILGALTKLRQVCCDPRLAGMGKGERSAKLTFLDELIKERLGSGGRILIFSQFTSMLKLIADRLNENRIGFVALTGATEDRAAVVDRFESGAVSVFLISLRAGGTGLTLTSADTVIHYDPWWNPAVQAQATDRAYRIGQKKPVFVHHLYVAGSVEERMLRLQRRKRKVSDAILGEGEMGAALTEEEIEVLFAPLGA
jgi:superfamily II DNA or RNA helicase